ncbi:MAG TPA: hypothetical protein VND64_17205 [Pirellulales bacterium]|nr:hypothetical protein [Pirellulales bacterium]
MRTTRIGNVLLALLVSGCHGAPTQEDRENARVLEALLTSITLVNPRLLEDNAVRVKTRHDEGHLTDEEYQSFDAVITKARGGDWAGAETACYEFRKKRSFVKPGQ